VKSVTHIAWLAYKQRKSPVIISYVVAVALVTLLALNLTAIPAINEFLRRFPTERSRAPQILKSLASWYWFGITPFVVIATILLIRSAHKVWVDLRLATKEARGGPKP